MNPFDKTLLELLNQFSRQSWHLDHVILYLSDSHLFKGGFLLLLLWYGWFKPTNRQATVRLHLISTLFGCFIAMALARLLAASLTFRLRPLHLPELNFTLAYGMDPALLEGWWSSSSFPSDHAVLFFALATGLRVISRGIGLIAIVYTCLFIALPRAYLGLHYPTDLIVGALIGTLVILLLSRTPLHLRLSRSVLHFANHRPELFYPVFFIVTYQIADMFESSRALVGLALTLFNGGAPP